MGVECSVIDAYTPFTNDGGISLVITGGTPPYSVSWSNGSHSQNLTNLQVGDYTATVVDYYGDFTGTTTCTVGAETFYIEEFESCTSPGSYLYYLANMNNQFSANTIYSLNLQSGCWISNGVLLYTAQTYYNYTATTVTGPFDTCVECIPTVPQLLNVSGMCLTTFFNNVQWQYQFYSGGTINGYPSWTGSSPSRTIYFNTGTTMWNITNWGPNFQGTPVLQSAVSPPIGAWTVAGSNQPVTLSLGECEDSISAIITSNLPSCLAAQNGTIQVTSVIGGTSPYEYALNNNAASYQVSNTFTNLPSGLYTVYVQDLIGNVSANVVNLQSQTNVTQYSINLNLVPANGTVLTSSSTVLSKSFVWEISVSPSLPVGKTLTFDITHVTNVIRGSGGVQASASNTPSTGTTGGGVYISGTTSSTTLSSTTTACSSVLTYSSYITSAITRTYNAKIVGVGTVKGTVVATVTTPNGSTTCAPTGTINNNISITNVTLSSQTICETLNPNVTPLTFGITKTGILAPVSSNTVSG
jgi:hypothetical protein